MRTAALATLLSAMAAIVLAVTAPPRPSTSAEITALTLPAEIFVGEAVAVRGSVLLPDEGVFDSRFRFCHLDTERCSTAGWGSVSGHHHWIGYAGDVDAKEPGIYRVIWTLHAPWAPDSSRAVARFEAEVTAYAPFD